MKYYLMVLMLILWGHDLAAQRKDQKSEELHEQALSAYRIGDYAHSLELAQRSQRLKPTARNAYLTGLIYEAEDKDLRAIAEYEASLLLNPDYTEARFQKALIYLEKGDPQRALEDFNYLLENGGIQHTNSVFFEIDERGTRQHQVMTLSNMESRLYYYRASAKEKLEELDAAWEDYTKAIRLDSSADYFVARALLLNKMGDTQSAMDDLKQAIGVHSENELAWYNLALLDESIVIPAHLLSNDGFGPILSLLASRAMTAEKYILAKKYLDLSINNEPDDVLSYINRGRALMKMNQYSLARKDFKMARRLSTQRHETLYLIGNSYFYEDEFTNALSYYNQYLTTDPSNAMVWYNGALCYLELESHEEACHYLTRAKRFGQQQADKLLLKYCE